MKNSGLYIKALGFEGNSQKQKPRKCYKCCITLRNNNTDLFAGYLAEVIQYCIVSGKMDNGSYDLRIRSTEKK